MIMAIDETKYLNVYTGTEVNVQHLQNIFEQHKIDTIVKNNFESGLRGGFGGGLPGQVQLFVHEDRRTEAEKIVADVFPQQSSSEK